MDTPVVCNWRWGCRAHRAGAPDPAWRAKPCAPSVRPSRQRAHEARKATSGSCSTVIAMEGSGDPCSARALVLAGVTAGLAGGKQRSPLRPEHVVQSTQELPLELKGVHPTRANVRRSDPPGISAFKLNALERHVLSIGQSALELGTRLLKPGPQLEWAPSDLPPEEPTP
jgi:hypothetical protein